MLLILCLMILKETKFKYCISILRKSVLRRLCTMWINWELNQNCSRGKAVFRQLRGMGIAYIFIHKKSSICIIFIIENKTVCNSCKKVIKSQFVYHLCMKLKSSFPSYMREWRSSSPPWTSILHANSCIGI